ncbi:MAG: hypothetical protein LUC24_06460 [Bacteroidales bacterium]|nr:hypothetical protein [Bacteroidales bacterium]
MTGCLLSIILTVIPSQGAFLTQLQPRDSILIADQLLYGFELKGVEEGTQLFFPEIKQEENQGGPMVLGGWQIDTLKVYKARKNRPASYDLRAGVVITSFDEGEYQLPPLATMRQTPQGAVDTLVFDAMTMSVKTIPIDEENFELHDIKGQIRYPVTFREILPYIIGFWVLATIVILVVCLVITYRRRAEGVLSHKDPAHIVALRKIDHYRGDRFWAAEKQKTFYSGVTDALREYIVARYGVAAMEMTTKEIFEGLRDTDIPKDLYKELEGLFQRADFVKFAKYVADREENAGVVPLAVRFVTATYQTEVDEESSEESEQTEGQTPATGQTEEQKGVPAEGQSGNEGKKGENSGIPEEHSRWLPKSEDGSKWYPKD